MEESPLFTTVISLCFTDEDGNIYLLVLADTNVTAPSSPGKKEPLAKALKKPYTGMIARCQEILPCIGIREAGARLYYLAKEKLIAVDSLAFAVLGDRDAGKKFIALLLKKSELPAQTKRHRGQTPTALALEAMRQAVAGNPDYTGALAEFALKPLAPYGHTVRIANRENKCQWEPVEKSTFNILGLGRECSEEIGKMLGVLEMPTLSTSNAIRKGREAMAFVHKAQDDAKAVITSAECRGFLLCSDGSMVVVDPGTAAVPAADDDT